MGLAFHTLQCQHQRSLLQPCQLAHPALARALTGPDNNCYMGGLSIGLGLQTASSLRGGKEGVEHGHMHFSLPQLGSQEGPLTCGGVGVDEVLAPDIISSVMSLPPWLGSRIRICPRIRVERGSCWQAIGHSTWATPFPSAQHPQDTLLQREKGGSFTAVTVLATHSLGTSGCHIPSPQGTVSHRHWPAPVPCKPSQQTAGASRSPGQHSSPEVRGSQGTTVLAQGLQGPPSFKGQYREQASAHRNHSELCATSGTIHTPTASLAHACHGCSTSYSV